MNNFELLHKDSVYKVNHCFPTQYRVACAHESTSEYSLNKGLLAGKPKYFSFR